MNHEPRRFEPRRFAPEGCLRHEIEIEIEIYGVRFNDWDIGTVGTWDLGWVYWVC